MSVSLAVSAGEKVEFSAPREVVPLKPQSERDLGSRSFNVQRRDLNPASEMPAGPWLQAPETVNRSRALQDLIERGGMLPGGEAGGDGLSLDNSIDPAAANTELGIDDLFPRRSSGGESGLQRDDGPFEGGTDEGRGVRDGAGRGRSWDRSGRDSTEAGGLGFEGDASTLGSSRTGFLPSMDLVPRDPVGAGGPNSRRSEGFLDLGGRSGAGRLGDWRTSDQTRARQDSLDSFRRLFSSGAAGRADGLAGGVSGPGTASVLGGGPPGGAPVAGATGFVGGSAAGTGLPAVAGGDMGSASRGFALPSRPVDLNLTIGRERNSSAPGYEPPPQRPMEMFQRKHDSRIPTRVF